MDVGSGECLSGGDCGLRECLSGVDCMLTSIRPLFGR